jgi:polyvinyl alcohol dehydrogenase (cytochrome)
MRCVIRIPVTMIATSLAVFTAGPFAFAQAPDGAAAFKRDCAQCHASPAADSRAPNLDALRKLTPEAVNNALTIGTMRLQGAVLTDPERRAVVQYLAGRPLDDSSAIPTAGRCTTSTAMSDPASGAHWNGWGAGITNTRFQPWERGGLTAAQVPNLKLKWAFGFPGVTSARSQPAVAGGRLFVGSDSGVVYSLDAKTGCIHWTYRAEAGIRSALVVGPRVGPESKGYAVYFADGVANAYALDASSGKQLWMRKLDDHRLARVTGSPTLHEGRLYVPTSGLGEEGQGGRAQYECCTFRGSVSAIDVTTGAVVWKSYMITEEPKPRSKNKEGVQTWGPSGAGIWAAPTVDVKRNAIYVSTGNGYSGPPQPTTDAVIALDLQSGKIRWVNQTTPNDVWTLGCQAENPNNPNCPEKLGPDLDFSASPILTTLANGRDLIVIPQKSGLAFALDPDKQGAIVWQYRAGQGSGLGGVWGAAVDDRRAYVSVADMLTKAPGGMHAVNLETGERIWYTPPAARLCGTAPGCTAGQGAAVTAIPGIVFSGSMDGGLRAYAAESGTVVWEFDTNREFQTVDGVKANGGAMDGPGPVVAGGMLYLNSGNAGIIGRPGNVLLAFGVD